ncbi:MAG: hypothetical protein D6722_25085 [Bacteroidetes bacterium]|nr:MAG: hypothetical protein D6722_25085 [Bacteroidota bacterium]
MVTKVDASTGSVLLAPTFFQGIYGSPSLSDPTLTGTLSAQDGSLLQFLGAGASTGDVISRIGASPSEGLELVVYEETISPAAIETSVVNVPAFSMVLAVQSNVETALTGGGTTDSYGIGTSADPDKYGSSSTLTQNSKSNYIGATPNASSEQIVLTGTSGGAVAGDTALTVGSVRIRVVYYTLSSLDNA